MIKMKDPKNIGLIEKLHPEARKIFTDFIEAAEKATGLKIRIVSGMRTFEEQEAIYEQGRTKPGKIVTWAKPGSSFHNYGLAIDVCPWKEDGSDLDWNYDFKLWAEIAADYNLTWGGNFPKGKIDPDHYQYTQGYHWSDLLKKHNAKDFIPGTTFVTL